MCFGSLLAFIRPTAKLTAFLYSSFASLFVFEICVYILCMPQISNTKIAAKSKQIKAVNLAVGRIPFSDGPNFQDSAVGSISSVR